VNVASRLAHTADDLRTLFGDQLRASDRLWKDLHTASAGQPLHLAIEYTAAAAFLAGA
jgi:hypothetical protein